MSKSIIINTDYLSTKKNRGGGEKPIRNTSLKPNKIKQALINRIKTYHSELLNKDRIEGEATVVAETPKSEFEESVEMFNQMAKEKDRRDERRKMRFNANLASGTQIDLPSPAYLEESRTRKNRPNNNNNTTFKITANDNVPYGILKGGSKPTYRQFSQSQQHIQNSPTPVSETLEINTEVQNEQVPSLEPETRLPSPETIYYERSKRFDDFKKRFNQKLQQKASQLDAPGTRCIRKKVKKHRTLGKHKGKISILVKNYETRRKIEKECAILKEKPIGVVKDFLRERGFIKMGSSAPDHILRQMYESCFLSGDVNNLNGENLLHNYLHDDNQNA
uniref:Uncharacterized protein n=1 Tax=viral metagenome TaxID=1070528 RepID=A0A6C0BW57_9ZZZZ